MNQSSAGDADTVEVRLRRLCEGVDVPAYARPGDGACDLRSSVAMDIAPLSRALVPTGISLEIPERYGGLIIPRSGLAINFGITCLNSPGLIDSGYRGEVKVILYNSDPECTFVINQWDRIAQLVIVSLPMISFAQVDELSESVRGAGGFGHTGVGGAT